MTKPTPEFASTLADAFENCGYVDAADFMRRGHCRDDVATFHAAMPALIAAYRPDTPTLDAEREKLVERATARPAILHASASWGIDEDGLLFDHLLDAIEADAAEIVRRDNVIAGLREALELLLEEKCDYMTLNKLGDPETQHTVKLARAALDRSAP